MQKAPELIFSQKTVVEELLERFDTVDSLIILSPHYQDSVPKFSHAQIHIVETPLQSIVEAIKKAPRYAAAKVVVGVGGGVSTDIAKAVGVDKELYIYPTILSTNCISNNRTVLGDGFDSFSFSSGLPKETIISLPELMSQPLATRAYWTASGYGDYVAELSAAIEQEILRQDTPSPESIIAHDPEVWAFIQEIAKIEKTKLFSEDFMKRMAQSLHSTSIKDLKAGTNSHRLGSEHDFYKALLEIDANFRKKGPSHGIITAIGTLLVTKIFEKKTANPIFYSTLRASFEKMGIPLSYSSLEVLGLTKELMLKALGLLRADPQAERCLKEYLETNGYAILEEVLG